MKSGSPSVVLVVPCYNEALRLREDAFIAAAERYPNLELLFVNDGSRDRTSSVLSALAARLGGRGAVLELPANGGKAAAVRSGVLQAFERQPDLIGYWDADLATPFDALDDFMDVFVARPDTELVIGSRVKLLGRHIHRRAWRHYVGRMMATFAALALGLEVYDTQCGAKVFRANERLQAVFAAPFRTKWVFDVELIARYIDSDGPGGQHRLADRLYEVPLRTWTDAPGSKVRLRDGLWALEDLGKMYWRRHRN
jgi:dolichyl-phosphate beta-glucosyltransferase